MSYIATSWAIKQDMPASKKFVLMVLAYHSNSMKGEVCYPSIRTIAKECSTSRGAVSRSIAYLVENNYITSTPDYYAIGQRTSNIYKLLIPQDHIDEIKLNIPDQREGLY